MTTPLPEPVPPLEIDNHVGLLLAAVHAQPAGAVTLAVLLPAADVIEWEVGAIEIRAPDGGLRQREHLPGDRDGPDPRRRLRLAVTLYDTVPLPDPLPPPVSVIQDALLCAVQAQPAPAVTDTVPLPASCPAVRAEGAIVGEHGAGANENWFDGLLLAAPPGPMAVTRAS